MPESKRMDERQIDAYRLAQNEVGLEEIPGAKDNAEVVQMFADVGHSWVKDDETAWCAAFVGAMLERAGLKSTRALDARSYNDWGEEIDIEDALPGDIVVFWRGSPNSWKGHVGFFVRNAGVNIEVLGGNQSDSVSIAHYSKKRLLSVRRMTTSTAPAQSLRPKARLEQKPRGLLAFIVSLFRKG